MSFCLKVSLLCVVFALLSVVQGRFIMMGPWIIKNKIPNHFPGQAAWGIFWVVTSTLIFGIITFWQWMAIALVFLSAFPGIYLAGVANWDDWRKCDLKKKILNGLELAQKQLSDMSSRLSGIDLG